MKKKPRRVSVATKIPREMHDRLCEYAEIRGVTVSYLLREHVRHLVAMPPKPKVKRVRPTWELFCAHVGALQEQVHRLEGLITKSVQDGRRSPGEGSDTPPGGPTRQTRSLAIQGNQGWTK